MTRVITKEMTMEKTNTNISSFLNRNVSHGGSRAKHWRIFPVF